MDVVLKYRGCEIRSEDVAQIRALIARHPEASRRKLSIELCKAWDWRQENGALRDAVCRGLLLALHRGGHIELPPARWRARKPWRRLEPERVEVDSTPVEMSLRQLGEVELRQVRRTPEEKLVEGLIAEHHYLGYSSPVGEHLKYLVVAGDRPLGCCVWSSAPRHLAPRDRHIGWSKAARKANIRFVAYQTRFLIVPWVRVPHLASYLLGRMARQLSADWEALYAHPVYFAETFVDPARNAGTCYRAANWTPLGLTKGRGKDAPSSAPNRSLKLLFGYPLVRDFRARMCTTEAR